MRYTFPMALPVSLAALLLSACGSTPTASSPAAGADAAGPPVQRAASCGFATLTVSTQPEERATAGPRLDPGRAAASALIETMTDAQRAGAVLPLDHDARTDWHFVPRRRPGLALGAMTDAQRHELHKLMQHALSDAGYLKAMDIVWLESVLEELENRSDDDHYRDPGRYDLLLFGDPGDPAAAWGWRFEGHHLSLNFTYTPAGVVTTPMFMGTAPAVVPSGLHAGKRILADEHNLAFAFIATLTDEQREQMMIGDVPGDVVTGPGRESSLREPAGIAYAGLNAAQQEKLVGLLMVYADRLNRADSERFVWPALIEQGIHFAWAGSTDPERPHYYRIYAQDQFVIEYCTRDGGVDHIHGVFHDLTDPLAEDLLRRHFEEHHAEE